MDVIGPTHPLHPAYVAAASPRHPGVPSWLFFVLVALANFVFLVTQVIINSVRAGSLPVSVLEEMFFPDVYWLIATTGVASLLASGLLLGVTLAILVVRAWIQHASCRGFGLVLLLQTLPWLYFASALLV